MITVKAKNNQYGRNGKECIPGNGSLIYVPEIDGKELPFIAETEDVALLLGIGYVYDGNNSKFAKMACRMLRINSVWAE